MEVVAVSYSQPSWHVIGGVQTFTSIIHTPMTSVQDCISLTTKGITGNEIAAHDGQVYAFFAHHYDYWTNELGLRREAWDWCHWGENITFRFPRDSELDESSMNLGDVWQVGSTVRLQVCGSRVPCNKLSWRCGQKDRWLKTLADSGRCGVYMKILRGGLIYPGDQAMLLEKHSESMDCAAISRLAFDSSLSTKDMLKFLVEDPNLMSMNKTLFRRKLSVMHDQLVLGKNAWKGWRRFQPSLIVSETADIKSFHLTPTDNQPLATYLPGQFLAIRLPTGLVRCWSISSWTSHDDPLSYRVSIRRALEGSKWMHEHCTTDTILELRSPSGGFHLDWTPMFPGRQIYISAGIGITPVLAMLKAHTIHPAMQLAPALWIHVSRDGRQMPFKKELSSILQFPHIFSSTTFFTLPRDLDLLGEHYQYKGRPTLEVLQSLITPSYTIDPLKITPIEIEGRFSTVYICGSPAFEASIKDQLREIGVPEPMVHSESFSEDAIEVPPLDKAVVKFGKSQRSAIWKRNGGAQRGSTGMGMTLLELAEQAGLVPEFGCRVGTCGSCTVGLRNGKVGGGLQPDGSVRVCIARPASDFVELDM